VSATLSLQYLPGETRAFLHRDGQLDGLAILRDGGPAAVGALYLGRVARLERRLNAAFVTLPDGPDGFLPLGDAPTALSEGALLAVRVTRVAAEDKGPRVTAKLEAGQGRLAEAPGKGPRLLAAGRSGLAALEGEAELCRSDDPAAFDLLSSERLERQLVPGGFAEAEAAAFDAEVAALLQPEVPLDGGGSLIVEAGRTLTAIDVNLGAGSAARVNEAAAREAARQLRLRSLGGRVVIDFVDSHDSARRAAAEQALKAAIAGDPERVKTVGWSRGGLYELTRRRSQPSLAELLLETAGDYGNRRKSAETLAFEALRTAALALRRHPSAKAVLEAPPVLARGLDAHPGRRHLEAKLGRTIAVREGGVPPFSLVFEED
jgi:Ribonuclease G/E